MFLKSKKVIVLFASLAVSTLIVIGFFYYSYIYLPEYKDVDMSNTSAGKTNSQYSPKTESHENMGNYSFLYGMFKEEISLQSIKTKRCRLALSNYYEDNGFDSNWKIFRILKDAGLNATSHPLQYNKNLTYGEFAVIIQNSQNGKRKVVVFCFNDDESLALTSSFDIPNAGYVQKTEDAYFILVSKQELSLSVYNFEGTELYKFPTSCSAYFGNKKVRGDHKTPEGLFPITELLKSDYISHDFKDGKGEIPGAYGPYLLRLGVPGYIDIGIHGTHDPGSMLKRVTEGCIRLRNEDILKIVPIVRIGTIVIITASIEDAKVG